MNRLLAPLLLGLALAAPAFGQTSAVPNVFSYQGRVSDAAGNLIGATPTPGPQNRVVTFRIWSHPLNSDAASRLYSEQQNVTIANGEFSVLIGAGTAVAGETNTLTLDAVFNGGATRYLGITVDDGNVGPDPEISPRQQIVTTAYAFRAKVAESVAALAVNSGMLANNAVTTIQLADTAVTTAKVTDLAISTAKLGDGAVTSAKIADGAIATADIGNAQITSGKLAPDIGVWGVNGANIHRTSGNVGIGTSAPQSLLSLGSALANTKLALFDPGTADVVGLGVQTGQFRFHLGNSASRYSFLSAPAGTELVTILGNGNMGLGHNTPDVRLLVSGAVGADGSTSGGFTFRGTGDADGGLFSPADGQVTIRTNNQERVRFDHIGNVGIGIATPPWPLSVFHQTDARASFMTPASGTTSGNGFHVGAHGSASYLWNNSNTMFHIGVNAAERHRIYPDGRVRWNTTDGDPNIAYMMKSVASAYILYLQDRNGNTNFVFQEGGGAFKTGGGGFSALSDRRLKTDIADLSGSLERLLRLRSVTFRYKDEQHGAGIQTGFVAQEVSEVFPDWVTTAPGGMLGVGPRGFEAITVQALRELRTEKDAQIARLESRIRELETQNGAQRDRVDALERRFEAFARSAAAGNNQ